jgi:type IV pilus assembly protein PilA
MTKTEQGFTLIELMIVVAILGLLAMFALPAYQDYTLRSKVSELFISASACKSSMAEYYQVKGTFPVDAKQAGCATLGSANAKPPDVSNGEIIVAANGALASQLGANGKVFGLKPDCGAAGCDGTPIRGWVCSGSLGASTNIPSKFLPSTCRG